MSVEFGRAVRQSVRLLILISGGTGSGKTESALRVATGLAGGKPIAAIDTENGRMLHKADDYKIDFYAALDEPFTPERYAEAVKEAGETGAAVVIIDSGSHEYEGIGGMLEIQIEEFERMGKRDSARMSSWIEPKRRHKRFVQQLLRSPAHVILCLRAEDKVEVTKDEQGKTVVRPRASLTGANGCIPICEKRLPFEATISLGLEQANPGVPLPIKLERRHAALIPLDRQLDEEVGRKLAEWARGGAAAAPQPPALPLGTGDAGDEGAAAVAAATAAPSPLPEHETLAAELLKLADVLGAREATADAIGRNHQQHALELNKHVAWLRRQITTAQKNIDTKAEQTAFQIPAGGREH